GLAHATLWRWVNAIVARLAKNFERDKATFQPSPCLIVDTTSTRARTTNRAYYTSYKKARVMKVQVLCDPSGYVHSVSAAYPGSVHDKVIWDETYQRSSKYVVLADKAYAGAAGEWTCLFRPIKRNEGRWKDAPQQVEGW